MSKPIRKVEIATPDQKSATVKTVFDTGSFYTIVREDKVPSPRFIGKTKSPWKFTAASKGSALIADGEVTLVFTIGKKQIADMALVSSELSQEMIIGAGTMQKWDISILNTNGKTKVRVGRDMHDPQITSVV